LRGAAVAAGAAAGAVVDHRPAGGPTVLGSALFGGASGGVVGGLIVLIPPLLPLLSLAGLVLVAPRLVALSSTLLAPRRFEKSAQKRRPDAEKYAEVLAV